MRKKKLHVKKGDIVKVLTGESKGQKGRILKVDAVKRRAIVEGINMVSKHTKPNAKNSEGGIIKQEAAIHISNLMLIDSKGDATRIGRKLNSNNKLVRYSKKNEEEIK